MFTANDDPCEKCGQPISVHTPHLTQFTSVLLCPEPPAQEPAWRADGRYVLDADGVLVAECPVSEDTARAIAALHNDLARVTAERDALADAVRDKIAWCDDMLRTAEAIASPWVRYSTTGVMGQRAIAQAALAAAPQTQTEATPPGAS